MPAILFQLLVTTGAVFIIVCAIVLQAVPKSKTFLLAALCVFAYAAGYLLELDAHTTEAAYFAQRVRFFGVPFIGVTTFAFVRDYNNRAIRGAWRIAAMLIVPALTIFAVNAYPEFTLFYRSMWFVASPTPRLAFEKGPMYYVNAVYNLLFIALATIEMAVYYPRRTEAERRMRITFLISILFPIAAVTLFAMDFLPVPMDFGSAALVSGMLFLGVFVMRKRPQDWLPFARQSIVENLRDGYVLLDNGGKYLDANAVAMGYFPQMRSMAPGADVGAIHCFPADAAGKGDAEYELHPPDSDRCLRASSTAIHYRGRKVCTCIMLYDITETHRLMDKLEALATRDELTGLLNRNALFREAARDFDLSNRLAQPLSAVMMDIDHFKDVNDRFGHPTGDEVLRAVGRAIRGRLRHTDIGGRYGGEEFCVLLPGTVLGDAARIACDIRAKVARERVVVGGTILSVTISAGVAQVDHARHATLDNLIADADAALYRAKREGRDRIALYEGKKPG